MSEVQSPVVPGRPAYGEEDVDLVVRALFRDAYHQEPDGPVAEFPEDSPFLSQARSVLAAQAAAGRLIPPGSEERRDWGVAFGPDDALDCTNERQARLRAERDGGTAEFRRAITTPWVTADPITTPPEEVPGDDDTTEEAK